MRDECWLCGGIGRTERITDRAMVICPACDPRYRIVAAADLARMVEAIDGWADHDPDLGDLCNRVRDPIGG